MTSLSPEQIPVPYAVGATERFGQTTPSEALRAIGALPDTGRVLLLGAADTGKTSFLRHAANFLAGDAGLPAALIDCDLGQSEIGPPGTLGLCVVRPGEIALPITSLHNLPLLDAEFVGATAPPCHLPAILAGAARLARLADRSLAGRGRVLIDTPGFIAGPAARALARGLAQTLDPSLILAFARRDEIRPILSLFGHRAPPPVVALIRPGPEVGRKTAAVRATRRSARLAHFLAGAASISLPWDSIDLVNSALGHGAPVAPHLVKFIGNVLGVPCLYAERAADGAVYALLSAAPAKSSGIAAVEEEFKTRHVALVPQASFQGLLCGLAGAHGQFLGIGLIERVDFLRRAFAALTTVRRPEAVAQVTLGSLRVRPDGREIGATRPGSV